MTDQGFDPGDAYDECPDHWHCDPERAAHACRSPRRDRPCPTCSEEPDCRTCGGHGILVRTVDDGRGGDRDEEEPCPTCTREIEDEREPLEGLQLAPAEFPRESSR